MSLDEIRRCTRRELGQLIDAMVSRRQGYQTATEGPKLESTEEIKARIAEARRRKFGEN